MNFKAVGLLLLIILLGVVTTSAQQTDSLQVKPDTIITKQSASDPGQKFKTYTRAELEKMPRRAAIRSAIIPGWGQLSNRRWWKVPLVYGGFVGLALVYDFNQSNYKLFLKEAQDRDFNITAPDPEKRTLNPQFSNYSTPGIITIKDGYRRNRDLSILAGLAFYTINIVDAYVDAKFFRFDITDELAIKVEPWMASQPLNAFAAPSPGIKLRLSL